MKARASICAILLALTTTSAALPSKAAFSFQGEVDRVVLLQTSDIPGPCGDGTIGAILISEIEDDREFWVQCNQETICQCRRMSAGARFWARGEIRGGYEPDTSRTVVVFLADRIRSIGPSSRVAPP